MKSYLQCDRPLSLTFPVGCTELSTVFDLVGFWGLDIEGERPLKKAMAGEGLLSQILIDKYVDHLPLHRQMHRFERAGVKIPYATLSGWVSETSNLISPLYEALKKEILQTNYLHADEAPIRVQWLYQICRETGGRKDQV